MGKKKRKEAPKPWCFYCDQEFLNEKILIDHQKARHFKCFHCGKKLPSSAGLAAHVLQVHKETITKVPNAKEGRDSIEIGVYGMENIPDEFLDEEERDAKRRKDETGRPGLPPGLPVMPVVAVPPMLPGMYPGTPGFGPPSWPTTMYPYQPPGYPPAGAPPPPYYPSYPAFMPYPTGYPSGGYPPAYPPTGPTVAVGSEFPAHAAAEEPQQSAAHNTEVPPA